MKTLYREAKKRSQALSLDSSSPDPVPRSPGLGVMLLGLVLAWGPLLLPCTALLVPGGLRVTDSQHHSLAGWSGLGFVWTVATGTHSLVFL